MPEQPIWIDGDEVRLTQIVANLLNNAATFTAEGGRVTLTMKDDTGAVEIVVSDSGIGIAPEMLRHIFEPFAQVDHAVDRVTTGLGIGLNLVQTLASLHGGTVKAESEGLGHGSRFTVRLPTIAHVAVPVSPLETRAEHATKARVLLVDDNADASLTLAMLLRLEGHDVAVAYEGREALRVAPEFRPDVILLDIGLPGMDGYEIGRRLRAEPTTAGAVMIALTGYSHAEARTQSREVGFDQHVVKPVDPAALIRSLAGLASRRSG
jgi:CheY-like chemotaxis protein